MQISPSEEFGIRCMLQLARLEGVETLSASKIAEREGLSLEYVSKILFLLRKGGLVQATRGAQGGFRLALPPSAVSLKLVMDAIQADTKRMEGDFCQHYGGQQSQCVHHLECGIRPVWNVLSGYFNELLGRISLSDLMVREKEMREKIKDLADETIRQLDRVFGRGLSVSTPLSEKGGEHVHSTTF